MKFKSLILGTAAAFAVVGSAQAADLAVAEPLDYVKVCDAYGTGFFYIPGSDQCLKVSARVRFDGSFSDTAGGGRGYDFVTKGYLSLTGKSQTAIGELTLFLEAEGKKEDAADLALGDVYIKVDGWTFGNLGSVANVDGGYGDYGGFRHDYGANQIAYSASMGGMTVAVGLEEGTVWGLTWGSIPNVSAAISGGMGGVAFKATATVADRQFIGGSATGYGFNLNASADLGGISVRGNVAWSQDAPALAGGVNGSVLGGPEGDVLSALAAFKAPIAGPIWLTGTVAWIDQGADTTSVAVGLQGDLAPHLFGRIEGMWSTTGGTDTWGVITRLQASTP